MAQIKAARQMDIPAKLAIPMRVIASIVAIACQLDAHVPIKALAEELIPGFAEPEAGRLVRSAVKFTILQLPTPVPRNVSAAQFRALGGRSV